MLRRLDRFLVPLLQLAALIFLLTIHPECSVAAPRTGPVPAELKERLKLDPFYKKYLNAGGIPVLGSAKVSDNALAETAWIIDHMLTGRDDIRKAMAEQKVRAVIMAKDEYTTDIPEHKNLRPKVFWDRRARGLGATPEVPAVSGAEENLLNFQRDPYPNENIFLHEFAHAIHETGMNKVDPTFDKRLQAAYEAARERGLWKNTYAATNHKEYWAEGVQSWFDDNAPPDTLHNNIRTRVLLKEYDPALAKLCKEVFGDGTWRYVKPRDRKPEDRAHLIGYDPKHVPRFRWREAPRVDRPQAMIQTAEGEFVVELDSIASREATTNFLRVALDGGYHSSHFTRVSNWGDGSGVVFAAVNPVWAKKWADELKLERLPDLAAPPDEGSIALIRDKSGSLNFAIFLGKQTKLPTESVFPFGHITKGEDVVRKILALPAKDGMLTQPVDIRRIIRSE